MEIRSAKITVLAITPRVFAFAQLALFTMTVPAKLVLKPAMLQIPSPNLFVTVMELVFVKMDTMDHLATVSSFSNLLSNF